MARNQEDSIILHATAVGNTTVSIVFRRFLFLTVVNEAAHTAYGLIPQPLL